MTICRLHIGASHDAPLALARKESLRRRRDFAKMGRDVGMK